MGAPAPDFGWPTKVAIGCLVFLVVCVILLFTWKDGFSQPIPGTDPFDDPPMGEPALDTLRAYRGLPASAPPERLEEISCGATDCGATAAPPGPDVYHVAYHQPCWGANGIPSSTPVQLPTRPGDAGHGALEYSHYAGLPEGWRPTSAPGDLTGIVDTVPESEAATHDFGTKSAGAACLAPVPEGDPTQYGVLHSAASSHHLNELPVHVQTNPPPAFGEAPSTAPAAHPYYRMLEDPDHEPYIGGLSYN